LFFIIIISSLSERERTKFILGSPLTSGKEFGQMFVFHQEEETMNLIKITNTIYKLHMEEWW